jgi:general secretion pathway protein I
MSAALKSQHQPRRPPRPATPALERLGAAAPLSRAFTLLEVMIAIAVLGIALLALLSLQHQDLQSVIGAQELTRTAMLAQTLMTQAEMERFPELGTTRGDFSRLYPGQYPNFRWVRIVEASGIFADVRKVEVRVSFGPGFGRSFDLVEFLHNPLTAGAPVPAQAGAGAPAGNQVQPQ